MPPFPILPRVPEDPLALAVTIGVFLLGLGLYLGRTQFQEFLEIHRALRDELTEARKEMVTLRFENMGCQSELHKLREVVISLRSEIENLRRYTFVHSNDHSFPDRTIRDPAQERR